MKGKYYFIFLCCLLLIGCSNQEETIKNEYIAMKSNLLNESNYTSKEDLPLDITIHIDRTGEEVVDYKVILENPKENMNELKAMVIHNYYNEDVYPSIGLFDEPQNLLVNQENSESNKENQIEIKDTIKTAKNISKLNLELKIWIEYKTDDGKIKDIYYKTT